MRECNDHTVRFVLDYPGLVDVDVLRAAAKAIVESMDVLHGTFFTEGMQISVISFDGACVLAVAVQCTKADTVVLQNTLDTMVKVITDYAAEG